jgi:hypothetical protein
MNKTPTQYEEEAVAAAKDGNYELAAKLFDDACGVTLGHRRAQGYRDCADFYRQKAKEKKNG